MTDPQATHADWKIAEMVHRKLIGGLEDYHPSIKCGWCTTIALALAKARQQAHAEMQAAIVDKLSTYSKSVRTLPEREDATELGQKLAVGIVNTLDSFIPEILKLTLDGTNALEEYISKLPVSEVTRLRNKYATPEERRRWLDNIHKFTEEGRKEDNAELKAKIDEAVAAVVEDCSLMARNVGTIMEVCGQSAEQSGSLAESKTLFDCASHVSNLASIISELKPNAQQILAERDKRVKEEACAEQRELREALGNLTRRMDIVHAASQHVFTLSALHGNEYTGPTYKKELEAARRALGEKS